MDRNAPATKRSRWLRKGLRLLVVLAVLMGAAFGWITFVQARAMTNYAPVATKSTRLRETKGLRMWNVLLYGPAVRRQSNTRTPADLGMQFSTSQLEGAHGLKLEIWRVPGQPGFPRVLMFPGYGASKDTLLHAALEFHACGCEMVLVDFHGVGGSEGAITSLGYHEAADVSAVVLDFDRKHNRDRPLVLYGVSMGAAASLRAVAECGVVPDGMILEAPFDRFDRTIGNRFELIGMPRFPFGSAVAFWAGVQQGFNGLAHNPVDYARAIRCPTLLLQGALDESVGLNAVGAVAGSLGNRATFCLIPNVGHSFLILNARAVWRRSVQQYLAAINGGVQRAQTVEVRGTSKNTLASSSGS